MALNRRTVLVTLLAIALIATVIALMVGAADVTPLAAGRRPG